MKSVLTQHKRFFHPCNSKSVCSITQGFSDWQHAMTVGVGLDDREHRLTGSCLPNTIEIVDERIEIDACNRVSH